MRWDRPCAPAAAGSRRPASRGTTCRDSRPSCRSEQTRPRAPVPAAARRAASRALLVAPLRAVHHLERERLLMEHRLLAWPRELPRRHIAETLVVPPGLALRRLVFLAEMAAERLLAVQGVVAHELGKLEEVRDPAGVFERLIQFFALTAHVDVPPELVAQRVDPSQRLFEPRRVPGHPALVPHQAAE